MIVTSKRSMLRLIAWQWRPTLFFLLAGATAYFVHEQLTLGALVIPTAPVTVVGAAIGIFVSFRANTGYSRWWEGRQLWGRMVNASRVVATQLTSYLPPSSPARERVLLRHCAYVHALRAELRDDPPLKDEHVLRLLAQAGDDPARYQGAPSVSHALLDASFKDVVAEADAGRLEPLRLQSVDAVFSTFLDVQGGCERIKRTPVPSGYAFIAGRLILAFSVLFPFAIVREVGIGVVPLNVLVCLAFMLISEVGRILEDPFTWFWNSLPISSISTNIERNVRARLGHAELPPPVAPDEKGVLW